MSKKRKRRKVARDKKLDVQNKYLEGLTGRKRTARANLIKLALCDLALPLRPDKYFLGKSVALSFGTFLLFLFFATSSPFTHWSFVYYLS